MPTPDLIKNYVAEAAISPYRIVKFGTADGKALQGAAVTDALMGVSDSLGGSINGRIDVIKSGIAFIEAGGTITRGDWLTSDANGKALSAAPGAGVNNNVIGRAEVSAVLGDIFDAMIAPGRIQG